MEDEEHELQVTDKDFVPSREDYINRELLADMEREIYFDNVIISYSGIFSYKELLEIINGWCKKRGYFKEVVSQKHKLTKNGKDSAVTYQLHRKFTPVHISVLDVTVSGLNMVDVDIELDGKLVTLNKGDAEIVFNGFLMSHMKHRWETQPKFAFIRRLIDKWVYKLDRPSIPGTVVADGQELANELRSSMYVYKHKIEAKEAIEKAEESIAKEEKKDEKKEDEKKKE